MKVTINLWSHGGLLNDTLWKGTNQLPKYTCPVTPSLWFLEKIQLSIQQKDC